MEIARIEFNEGKNRLALEEVEDAQTPYQFVWRGNKKGPNGFVCRPAYFDLEDLGLLIQRGFESGKITPTDINKFMHNLRKWNAK